MLQPGNSTATSTIFGQSPDPGAFRTTTFNRQDASADSSIQVRQAIRCRFDSGTHPRPRSIAFRAKCTVVTDKIPANPKIYHIVHVDRLPSIVESNGLICDAQASRFKDAGTTIGINRIKGRRLRINLTSKPDLTVGQCVPFYFCPRSIMLYLLHRANHPDLSYRGGQSLIVHLEADLRRTVAWANKFGKSWVITDSNASSNYFEDFSDLCHLGRVDWEAVQAIDWRQCSEGKQAEFLVEGWFPWSLVERIGVVSQSTYTEVHSALQGAKHRPVVQILPGWYY